jgi:protease-4
MKDRGWSLDHLEQVAGGRVWTGKDALQNGLVDALGGYEVAIAEVKQALGLEKSASINLQLWPRPKSSFEEVVSLLQGDGQPLAKISRLLGSSESSAVAELADRLGLSEKDLEALKAPAGVLQMPIVKLRY